MRLVGVAVVVATALDAHAQVGPPPPADTATPPTTAEQPPPPPPPAEAPAPVAPAPPPPAPAPATAGPIVSDAQLWLGAELDLQPSGSLYVEANNTSASIDSNSPLGLGGIVDLRLSRFVTVGLAPRILMSVRPKGALDSGRQIDLRARINAGNFVAPRVHLHGVGTAGYSIISHVFSVFDQNGDLDHYMTSKGLVVGFGVGLAYLINPRLLFKSEISYQLGFQGATEQGIDVEASSTFVTLGFGLVAAVR